MAVQLYYTSFTFNFFLFFLIFITLHYTNYYRTVFKPFYLLFFYTLHLTHFAFFFKIEIQTSLLFLVYFFIMHEIIHHDIYNMLYSISILYNIDIHTLTHRYLPTINIQQKKKFTRKRTNTTSSNTTLLPTTHQQCSARIWANGHLSYNIYTKKWSYGKQCSKFRFGHTTYCSIHLAVIKKHNALSHGDFHSPPPHPHFEKFKH